MGNQQVVVHEAETISEHLLDVQMIENVCTKQWADNNGNLYDVSGSGRKGIKEYATVRYTNNPGVAKMQYELIDLGQPLFKNVRKGKVTRHYDNGKDIIEDNAIFGDFNGKSYNITIVYPKDT